MQLVVGKSGWGVSGVVEDAGGWNETGLLDFFKVVSSMIASLNAWQLTEDDGVVVIHLKVCGCEDGTLKAGNWFVENW